MSLSGTTTASQTPKPTATATATKGNGNAQACAACKYQRRKCAPDCLLAPYFPHDSQRQFLNAHRLFGVSNITKVIKHLRDPRAKDDAMRTIIFQSDARASDPVGGCYRIIRELHRQVNLAKAELDLVLHHLALCRAAAATQGQAPQDDHQHHVVAAANTAMPMHECHFLEPVQDQQYVVVPNDIENNNNNNNNNNNQDDVISWVVQDSSVPSSSTDLKQDVDVKPFLQANGGPAGFEPDHRRDEAMLMPAVLKEDELSIQQADDDDLRDAATMFTLTNCSS